jgi:hypothetical protein
MNDQAPQTAVEHPQARRVSRPAPVTEYERLTAAFDRVWKRHDVLTEAAQIFADALTDAFGDFLKCPRSAIAFQPEDVDVRDVGLKRFIPEEAIKFVTLNPAKQLKIDSRVGSIEPGKDADLSIWNGSPLSPYSRCEQTWIEGRRYFDRVADLAGRAALEQERETLVAKAKAAKKPGGGAPAGKWPPRYLDATDSSGNDCGGGDGGEFVSEAERDARRSGEVRP